MTMVALDVKVDERTRDQFVAAAGKLGQTPADLLAEFVHQTVRDNITPPGELAPTEYLRRAIQEARQDFIERDCAETTTVKEMRDYLATL